MGPSGSAHWWYQALPSDASNEREHSHGEKNSTELPTSHTSEDSGPSVSSQTADLSNFGDFVLPYHRNQDATNWALVASDLDNQHQPASFSPLIVPLSGEIRIPYSHRRLYRYIDNPEPPTSPRLDSGFCLIDSDLESNQDAPDVELTKLDDLKIQDQFKSEIPGMFERHEKQFRCDRIDNDVGRRCSATFSRKLELTKHLDCAHKRLDCPVFNCARKDDQGFSRRVHRAEHLQRIHRLQVPRLKEGWNYQLSAQKNLRHRRKPEPAEIVLTAFPPPQTERSISSCSKAVNHVLKLQNYLKEGKRTCVGET